MLQKYLPVIILMFMMFVVVLGFGAPNLYAQQVQEWKTYREPLQFSIDYPVMKDQVANISTEHNKQYGYDLTIIDTQPILTMITRDYISFIDPQERAVMDKENAIKDTKNIILLQDIFTSIYDDKIGYTYVTEDLRDGAVTTETFIQNGSYMYKLVLLGMSTNPNLISQFDKILGSIKFF